MNLQKNQMALIFIALALFAIMGTIYFVSTTNAPSPSKENSSIATVHIDPSVEGYRGDGGGITREMSVFLKNETISPESSSSCQLTGPLRTDSLVTSTDSNITASAQYTLYKEEFNSTYDSSHDYYLVWMKAAGSSMLGIPENNSRITELRAGIILEQVSDRITDWSPYTDTSGPAVPHEETVRMGRCGILSETYTLEQGSTGVISLSPGSSNTTADFIIRWGGELNGTQVIVGGTEIQVPKNAGYNYTVVLGVNGTNVRE
jgi:hypothetical protein